MSVYVEGIGNQKISYQDHNNVDFSCLSDYLTMAKKSISKFANGFYNGLATKMLKDEDAISSIAYCLMLADWRYDENYNKNKKQNKTQYSYRNQCAIWAIQSYVTKNYKKKNPLKSKVYSLDYSAVENEHDSYYYIKDEKSPDPISQIMEEEGRDTVRTYIKSLLDNSDITEKQKQYIELYYFKDYTFEEIGKEFRMTREAIRQSIKKALSKIREVNNEGNG